MHMVRFVADISCRRERHGFGVIMARDVKISVGIVAIVVHSIGFVSFSVLLLSVLLSLPSKSIWRKSFRRILRKLGTSLSRRALGGKCERALNSDAWILP